MLTVRVSTRYNIAAGGAVRAGTIGLCFSNPGNVRFITEKGDTVNMQAVAGQEIETGVLTSVVQCPSQTVAVVGR